MRSITGTGIISLIDNDLGHVVIGRTPSGGASLPITADTFARNCSITDSSTGITWKNKGTNSVPLWDMDPTSTIVQLTAAQLIAMYATPVALIPAVPGKSIIVDAFEFIITRTSTAFTGGGVVAPQYDSTANGAGTAATATVAATVVTGAAGKTITARIPVVQSDIAQASIEGIGLFLSNATAAFAAGTGTAVARIAYHLV